MKTLNPIEKSIKRFGKGMLAVFVIKLLLFGGAFIIQSCQTDSIEYSQNIEQELALFKFEGLVKTSIPKIQSIVVEQHNLSFSKNTSAVVATNTDKEIREILMPMVTGTKELLATFDFTETDLSEEFNDLEDPRIALIGLAVLAAKDETNNQTAMNFANIFGKTVYAQDAYDCLLRSVGIDAVIELVNSKTIGSRAAKKLMKKAVRKIASRTLGWVGAAVAIYEFGDCMNWY